MGYWEFDCNNADPVLRDLYRANHWEEMAAARRKKRFFFVQYLLTHTNNLQDHRRPCPGSSAPNVPSGRTTPMSMGMWTRRTRARISWRMVAAMTAAGMSDVMGEVAGRVLLLRRTPGALFVSNHTYHNLGSHVS